MWRVKWKENLIFLFLALAGHSVAMVVPVFTVPGLVPDELPVLGPVRAKLPGLEVAWGFSSRLPGYLADMSWYPVFCQQRVVPL